MFTLPILFFIAIVLFILGGLLFLLRSKSNPNKPKNGWQSFSEDSQE